MRLPIRLFSAATLFAGLTALLAAATPSPATMAGARAADLPTQLLPIYGGTGGTAFTRTCGTDRVLTGLQFRAGMEVDGLGLLCRPVNANGSLGSETTVGSMVGGGGGSVAIAHCDAGRVVAGAYLSYGWYLDGLSLICRPWNAATRSFGSGFTQESIGRYGSTGDKAREDCEAPTQPAIGIRGRAASLVDAFGLICDEP